MAASIKQSASAPLKIAQLEADIKSGKIDTVIVGITDMQGRLQGKRMHAPFFLKDTMNHGTEGCNYLLAVDVDMNTVSGFAMSSWDSGYGDMVMAPDYDTLRYIPWLPGTAMVLADLLKIDHTDVYASPRQILKKQINRLKEHKLVPYVGTELEFIVFKDSFEEAWNKGYKDLIPGNQYNVDYSLLGTTRVEGLLRAIRLGMDGAGLEVESAKGECNFGQHEIAFRFKDALTTADNHVIYKLGAKEIAAEQNMSLTFMAKFNEREGSSCHIHLSVRGENDEPVMADDKDSQGLSALGKSFIAGQLKYMREMTLFFAPNINSYKRYVEGSFAPTALKWGRDNRTCSIRLVGHGHSLRFENRVPGGDVNPYLAEAAMIAAGIAGIEEKLTLEPAFEGNAYVSDAVRVPSTLTKAADLWEKSDFVAKVFGQEVKDHYLNMARVEIAAFDRSITDWERFRSFERM
ncbi:MAG: glutamine synthetase family protein [Actinomycetes bacterium]|jgi:glutamine synthetase